MKQTDVMRTEVLSYLLTKAEHCSSDYMFKVKSLGFMEYSPGSLGRICADLMKDGLVVKIERKHTPCVWRTNLMAEEACS